MPIPPGAIDNPQPILPLLAPARPLPAAPKRPDSNRPVVGDAVAPRTLALAKNAAAVVRGPIGSVATVGPNAGRMGAPGVLGLAQQHHQIADRIATDAIGSNVDATA